MFYGNECCLSRYTIDMSVFVCVCITEIFVFLGALFGSNMYFSFACFVGSWLYDYFSSLDMYPPKDDAMGFATFLCGI